MSSVVFGIGGVGGHYCIRVCPSRCSQLLTSSVSDVVITTKHTLISQLSDWKESGFLPFQNLHMVHSYIDID